MFCFLLHLFIIFEVGLAARPTNCSSSCGNIQIRYPFQLKNDPAGCGEQRYELACISDGTNNKTEVLILQELYSHKYYVTDISYRKIQVVDVDAKLSRNNNNNNSSCSVPSWSVPSHLQYQDRSALKSRLGWEAGGNGRSYYLYDIGMNYTLIAFVNCSERIEKANYHLVPCLNTNPNRTSGFVYVLSPMNNIYYDPFLVGSLVPSCSFLSMVPIMGDGTLPSDMNDVFQQLQKSFALGFRRKIHLIFVLLLEFCCKLMLVVVVPQRILAAVCICVFLCHKFWKMRVPMDIVEKFLRFQKTLSPSRYSYSDVAMMTRNFKEKLGQGGCGSVFRGLLPAGPPVAVKMLDNSKCKGEDFISEVSTIGRIHHLNVVRLLGYCSEGSRRALIYEFMPSGSLDKYIFSSDRHFSNEKLNEIALGVARGIDYLHRGCDMRILHFDIKPQNILLDRDFKPKVADFGLAKLYPKDYSHVSDCLARGTVGYIAPELVSRSFGVISSKSDVYSFGMLLMEMAGGRRNVNRRAERSSQIYYPSWIYDRLEQQRESGSEIICDEEDIVEIDNMEKKLSKVGLWCIQMRPSDRPSMSKVIEMLEEADLDMLPMPPKPFLNEPIEPVVRRKSQMSSSFATELSIISENEY